MASTLRRYRPRTRRHSLDNCLRGLAEAVHPQQRLSWMLILLVSHGFNAVEGLVRLIRCQPSGDLAESCAFALGRLGRGLVVELEGYYKTASPASKDYLCQALWYLGLQAHGCQNWLGDHDTPWARALLYRLQGWGWEMLMERRAEPLWLDDNSLARLGMMAFSSDPEDQYYAIRALRGIGPSQSKVPSLLEAASLDRDPAICAAALHSLARIGAKPSPLVLQLALTRGDRTLRQVARRLFGQDSTEQLQEVPVSARYLNLLVESLQLRDRDCQQRALDLLAEHSFPAPGLPARIFPFLEHPEARTRRAAAVAYAGLGGNLLALLRLLEDPDPAVSEAAAHQFVEKAGFDMLRLQLHRPALLWQMRAQGVILNYLSEPARLEALEVRLGELCQHGEEKVRVASRRVLAQLELDSIHWSKWEHFNRAQRQIARHLMDRHQGFPHELLESFWAGHNLVPTALAEAANRLPVTQAVHLFSTLLMTSSQRAGSALAQALCACGEQGWRALAGMLSSQEEWAGYALQAISLWLARPGAQQQYLKQSGPAILEGLTPSAAQISFVEVLGEIVLQPDQEDRLLWALALATQNCRGAEQALQVLRATRSTLLEGRAAQVALECLRHPKGVARSEALELLCYLKPDGLSESLRTLPFETDSTRRLLTLCLLHELDGLTPAEVSEVRMLAGMSPSRAAAVLQAYD
ncbi:HEAT repeat domain-containing protein [bacterium]|nr:HEAT repeat domain-containing protein [bacterium]